MKLLLNQHLSRKLVASLQPAFPGSSHVIHHHLQTGSDDSVWEFARTEGFAIVTKDEDYQVLSFARGHPPKVVWLRSGNLPTSHVLQTLLRARQMIDAFGDDLDRSLLTLP